MSVGEWTAVIGLALAVMTAIYSSMRFMVRSIMRELTPNGGKSIVTKSAELSKDLTNSSWKWPCVSSDTP